MDWTKLDWTGPNGLIDPWGHGSILHHNRNKLDLGNFVNKMPHMDLDHLRHDLFGLGPRFGFGLFFFMSPSNPCLWLYDFFLVVGNLPSEFAE